MECAGEIVVQEWPGAGREVEDLQLVRAVLRGEPSAFDLLVERHAGQVTSVVRRLLRDPGDLEDVVQETFLRAYQNLHRYRGNASLRTWLTQIAINLCRSRARTFWRRFVVVVDHPRLLETGPPGMPGLDEQTARQQVIDAAVGRLPEKLRVPFVLHAYEELSGAEIAEVLGWSESTVWTRIYAATRRLRRDLSSLLER